MRYLELDLAFLNHESETLSAEKIRVELEGLQTGMFQKEVSLRSIEAESFRSIQISIQSVACFSGEGNKIDCPEIQIIPPDTFHLIKVEDDSQNVCSA